MVQSPPPSYDARTMITSDSVDLEHRNSQLTLVDGGRSPSEWPANDREGALRRSNRYDFARGFGQNIIRVLHGHHVAYYLYELGSLQGLNSTTVLLRDGRTHEPLATIQERRFLSDVITIDLARSHWQTPATSSKFMANSFLRECSLQDFGCVQMYL